MSLEQDLPNCHSVSQGPRDPCGKDQCIHRNSCTRYMTKVPPKVSPAPACFAAGPEDGSNLCANPECILRTSCKWATGTPLPVPSPGWQEVVAKNKPVSCSDCAKWTSCPTLALRNRGYGCSIFLKKDWTYEAEEICKPETQVVLEQLQSIFAGKDARIKELEELLEAANRKADSLADRLDSISAAVRERLEVEDE